MSEALVPLDYVPCGAKTRAGGQCRRRPSIGKDRCRMHGGRPITHGRYSRLAKQSDRIVELTAEFAADRDPLDTKPELALVRALLHDWVERYSELTAALLAWHADRASDRPYTVPDITQVVQLTEALSKGAKRERDTQNTNWISRKDLARLIDEMANEVRLEWGDDAHTTIRKRWGDLVVKS